MICFGNTTNLMNQGFIYEEFYINPLTVNENGMGGKY